MNNDGRFFGSVQEWHSFCMHSSTTRCAVEFQSYDVIQLGLVNNVARYIVSYLNHRLILILVFESQGADCCGVEYPVSAVLRLA